MRGLSRFKFSIDWLAKERLVLMSLLTSVAHFFESPKLAQVGALAGTCLSVLSPGLGSLVETIAGATYRVEQTAATGASGADKKASVKAMLDVAAPVTLQVLSTVAGKTVTDGAALAPALDSLIDTIVALQNTLGVFPHKATAATPPAPIAA